MCPNRLTDLLQTRRGPVSKYAPLSQHLVENQGDQWRAQFSEVESILGFGLPRSARTYPAWWANDARQGRQCMAWLSVGWRTQDLDLGAQAVTFKRSSVPEAETIKSTTTARVRPSTSRELPGPGGKDRSFDPLEISIRLRWRRLGEVSLNAGGSLVFPSAPAVPGLYRFRLSKEDGVQHYIGETVNFQRRFHHYRRPGPTQMTNLRINERFLAHLDTGGRIDVDAVMDGAEITVAGEPLDVSLTEKATRRLLEHAAIVGEVGHDIETLNL